MTPIDRLVRIMQERRLRGFPPFGTTHPVVCLSECPLPHLQWLLAQRGFPRWGLILDRQWVYRAGGGPAWYVRQDQYRALSDEQRAWAVRLESTVEDRSDWLHEREWRIPVAAENDSAIALTSDAVGAILVEYPVWQQAYEPAAVGVPVLQRVATRWPGWADFTHWWLNDDTNTWGFV
jgi:hypothetical protein